jgi:hypothetical protein
MSDSDPRLQSKPFIYRGFIGVGSQSYTGIFTCLAARSENCHCSAIARPLLAYATDPDPDTLILQQLFRDLHGVERCAVRQILKIMDAAKATTVKSVSVFTKETARRVLKLI